MQNLSNNLVSLEVDFTSNDPAEYLFTTKMIHAFACIKRLSRLSEDMLVYPTFDRLIIVLTKTDVDFIQLEVKRLFPHASIQVLTKTQDIVKNVLKTASGINSRIIGSLDCLENFKEAHRLNERYGSIGPLTSHLVDQTYAFCKSIKRQSRLNNYLMAYANIGNNIYKQYFKGEPVKALLLGSGKHVNMMSKILKQKKEVNAIHICGYDEQKSKKMARNLGLEHVSFAHLREEVNQYNLIISDHNSGANLDRLLSQYPRNKRPSLILDFNDSEHIEGVYHFTLPDLQSLNTFNVFKRKEELPKVIHMLQKSIKKLIDVYSNKVIRIDEKSYRELIAEQLSPAQKVSNHYKNKYERLLVDDFSLKLSERTARDYGRSL